MLSSTVDEVINHSRMKFEEFTKMWKLGNMFLNNQSVGKNHQANQKVLEKNWNKKTIYQTQGRPLKQCSEKNLQASIKKKERFQINNVISHLKILAKQEQTNPNSRKDIIKIRKGINKIRNKKNRGNQ